MTYFTFDRSRLFRGEEAFDGDKSVGSVFVHKPWRERLALDDRPPLYLAKLPSGRWLPGHFLARHDAAEALRAHSRCLEYEELALGD
jgi:hypothetical protein